MTRSPISPRIDPHAAASALGEDWWVLDDALRIYRELGEKKGREVLILREFRSWYRGFPVGSVFATETPDFLVESPEGRGIGVEITECLRGDTGRKGSRHRARWKAEERVKRLAENLYYGGRNGNPSGAVPVRVSLHWPPAPPYPEIFPQTVEEMAAEIAAVVRQTQPEWHGGDLLQICPDRLAHTALGSVVRKLTIRRESFTTASGRGPGWTASRSHPIESADASSILGAIQAKSGVFERCKEACGKVWLVVALVGGGDSFQCVQEEALTLRVSSPYDRLFLLCLDGGPGGQRVLELRKEPGA